MYNYIIDRIENVEDDARKRQLKYIFEVYKSRNFTSHMKTAILNNFSQIIRSDIDLLKYFEDILTDCFISGAKEFHIEVFKQL